MPNLRFLKRIHSCPVESTSGMNIPNDDTDGSASNEDKNAFFAYYKSTGIPLPSTWGDCPIKNLEGDDTLSESTDITVSSLPSRSSELDVRANCPVFLAPSSRVPDMKFNHSPMYGIDGSLCKSIPMDGTPVSVSSPLFEGVMVNRVKGMGDEKYFEGRRRSFQWTLQGKFKKRIRFDHLVTGQDLGRPFRNVPNVGFIDKGLHLLKGRLPDVFESRLAGDKPKFEHAIINGCQHFRVEDPNQKGAIFNLMTDAEDGNIVEENSLLNDPSVPKDGEKRKKYFAKLENLVKFHYETEYVYTFNFYANFFNMAKYSFELTPFVSIDLAPFFNGYPIYMAMLKDSSSDENIIATEIWHKRLLDYDQKPGLLARIFANKKVR